MIVKIKQWTIFFVVIYTICVGNVHYMRIEKCRKGGIMQALYVSPTWTCYF